MSIASTKKATARAAQLREIAKAIETANKNFSKMTPPQKRVAIAKDAISQLKAGNYTAEQGSYVSLDDPLPCNGNREMIEIFQENPVCTVCARGALFVSACRTMNNCTIDDINAADSTNLDSYAFEDYEGGFFDKDQIDLIETAFETGVVDGDAEEDNFDDAIAFGKKYSKPEKRMLAILENIVKNKGTFVP